MRRASAQLLAADRRSIEKRSCKRPDNNERPNYQNVRFWLSLSASFSVVAVSFLFRSPHSTGITKRSSHKQCGRTGRFDPFRNTPMLPPHNFFGGIAMLKRSFVTFLIPAFACGILNAQELSASRLHQPTLTPQNSGTTNGLIAVWPVNPQVVWASGRAGTFTVTTDGGQTDRKSVV